MGVCDLNY
uniref:Cytochrome b6/f complex subunit IV n=1 Tax=Dunalia spinosa TaxID=362349 RepID=A0A139ZME2_9SOLA|nr:cytochrome b6/f complex subunit IV [Dunalia spinosa]UJH19222.1 cytochrome b6/f complex subunit IV [Polygonatum cyrtonema]WPT28618.1 PetD [Sideritis syriaca subsp. syriaca]